MQKIIIDTNVLVSSILSRSYPNFIIRELFLKNKIHLCISLAIGTEYEDVLFHPKFLKYSEFQKEAELLITQIEAKALNYFPKVKINIIADLKDNKFLELAEECNADFIITGNSRDFTFSSYINTRIVSPKVYWDSHKPD